MQWTASEISLPPFLERRFGESVPIYTIQSIHMLGCLILPPIAQAFTSSLEDFRVILPGLWIMAASPIFVALSPTVFGACVWQIAMTAGQVRLPSFNLSKKPMNIVPNFRHCSVLGRCFGRRDRTLGLQVWPPLAWKDCSLQSDLRGPYLHLLLMLWWEQWTKSIIPIV